MSVHPSSAATYPWEIEHERVGINIISTSDANRKYSHKSGNRIMYIRENEYPINTCIYNGGDGRVKKWRPMTRTGWGKAPCSSTQLLCYALCCQPGLQEPAVAQPAECAPAPETKQDLKPGQT